MHPVVEELWHDAAEVHWTPRTAHTRALTAWNTHRHKATWTSFRITFVVVQEMVGGTAAQPMAAVPPQPPDDVLAPVGELRRGRAAFTEAWNVLPAVLTSINLGVDDPFLERQLKAVSAEFKGHSVYAYSWLTNTALRYIMEAATTETAIDETFDRIEAELDDITQ